MFSYIIDEHAQTIIANGVSSHVMNLSMHHDVITDCKQLKWTIFGWFNLPHVKTSNSVRLGYVRLGLG